MVITGKPYLNITFMCVLFCFVFFQKQYTLLTFVFVVCLHPAWQGEKYVSLSCPQTGFMLANEQLQFILHGASGLRVSIKELPWKWNSQMFIEWPPSWKRTHSHSVALESRLYILHLAIEAWNVFKELRNT